MKANELMIGNIVRQKGSGIILEIEEIKPPYIMAIGELGQFHEDTIEPIPLTPEILEKNGFVKVFSEYWCMDEWKCRSIGTAWVDYENCIRMEIETNGVHITTPIHYIHELQHALKLCCIVRIFFRNFAARK